MTARGLAFGQATARSSDSTSGSWVSAGGCGAWAQPSAASESTGSSERMVILLGK